MRTGAILGARLGTYALNGGLDVNNARLKRMGKGFLTHLVRWYPETSGGHHGSLHCHSYTTPTGPLGVFRRSYPLSTKAFGANPSRTGPPDWARPVAVAYRKDAYLSPASRRFIEILKATARGISRPVA
jgi:hypothetical protein